MEGLLSKMKSRSMSEFGRVTVKTELGQLSETLTDFQSEELDRSGDRNPRPRAQ